MANYLNLIFKLKTILPCCAPKVSYFSVSYQQLLSQLNIWGGVSFSALQIYQVRQDATVRGMNINNY